MNGMTIKDSLMGFIIGDALGLPVEFSSRDTYKIEDMTEYGFHNQPAGTWSDDTSMMLATIDSILECGQVDSKNIMAKFIEWYTKGQYTPYGKVFDIGGGTKRALDKYISGIPLKECGGTGKYDSGNGALMRILPIVYVVRKMRYSKRKRIIEEVACITHKNEVSTKSCLIYSEIIRELTKSYDKKKSVKRALEKVIIKEDKEFNRLYAIGECKRADIKSSGYVLDTLESVIWSFLNGNSYEECVLNAVNLGEDADTIGALTGGLAGIIYKIPSKWVNELVKTEYLRDKVDIFSNKVSGFIPYNNISDVLPDLIVAIIEGILTC